MLEFSQVIKMKWISTIKKIGPKAISPEDRVVILFGESANEELADVSVIQEFDADTPAASIVLKKGDTITIDGITYDIEYTGSLVNSNLKKLQHASLFFTTEVPKKPMSNAIYVDCPADQEMPVFRVDDEIVYEHL